MPDGIITILFFFLIIPHMGMAQKNIPDSAGQLGVWAENDALAKSDYYYTHGWGINWISRGHPNRELTLFHPFFRLLNSPADTLAVNHWSLSIRQTIYTPNLKYRKIVVTDENPYAGLLALSLGFYNRCRGNLTSLIMEIGMVGPATGAEGLQKLFHQWIDSKLAEGWDNQLENEFAWNVYIHRYFGRMQTNKCKALSVDLTPHTGLGLGTIKTQVKAGFHVRLGFNLPKTAAVSESRSGFGFNDSPADQTFRLFLFAGAAGRLVFRNIFLDGNLSYDSHKVDKHLLTGSFYSGINIQYYRCSLTAHYTLRTKEYILQKKMFLYGGISLSCLF